MNEFYFVPKNDHRGLGIGARRTHRIHKIQLQKYKREGDAQESEALETPRLQ